MVSLKTYSKYHFESIDRITINSWIFVIIQTFNIMWKIKKLNDTILLCQGDTKW